MKVTLEKKTILTSLGFMLGLILVVAIVIIPVSLAIHQMQTDMFQLRLFLEQRLERATRLKAAAKNLPEIKATAAGWKDRLVERGDELRLITFLENLAAKNGVKYKITSSNLDKPAEPRLALTIAAAGSYRKILSYLAGLEKSDYFIMARSVNLQRHPETATDIDNDPMTILTLGIETYAITQ